MPARTIHSDQKKFFFFFKRVLNAEKFPVFFLKVTHGERSTRIFWFPYISLHSFITDILCAFRFVMSVGQRPSPCILNIFILATNLASSLTSTNCYFALTLFTYFFLLLQIKFFPRKKKIRGHFFGFLERHFFSSDF